MTATSQAYNRGVAHLRIGDATRPACRTKRAHYWVDVARFRADAKPCKRCAAVLANMDAKKAARSAQAARAAA